MNFRSINPATGEVLQEFPLQTDDEVFAALTTAGRTLPWRLEATARC